MKKGAMKILHEINEKSWKVVENKIKVDRKEKVFLVAYLINWILAYIQLANNYDSNRLNLILSIVCLVTSSATKLMIHYQQNSDNDKNSSKFLEVLNFTSILFGSQIALKTQTGNCNMALMTLLSPIV